MKKKLFILSLVLVMMTMFMGATALAAENPSLDFALDKTVVTPGEEVTVTVSLTGYDSLFAKNIHSLCVEMSFDESILTYVPDSATFLMGTPDTMNDVVYHPTEKQIRFIYNNLSGSLAKSGTPIPLFSFTVKAADDLSAAGNSTEISVDYFDGEYDPAEEFVVAVPSITLAIDNTPAALLDAPVLQPSTNLNPVGGKHLQWYDYTGVRTYGDYFNAITGIYLSVGGGAETYLTTAVESAGYVVIRATGYCQLDIYSPLLDAYASIAAVNAAGYSVRIVATGYTEQTVGIAPPPPPIKDAPVIPTAPDDLSKALVSTPTSISWYLDVATYADYVNAITEVWLTVGTGDEKTLPFLNGYTPNLSGSGFDTFVVPAAVAGLSIYSADMNAFTTLAELTAAGYTLRIKANGYTNQTITVLPTIEGADAPVLPARASSLSSTLVVSPPQIMWTLNSAAYGDYIDAITGIWMTVGDGDERELTYASGGVTSIPRSGFGYTYRISTSTTLTLCSADANACVTLYDLLVLGYTVRIEAYGYKEQIVTYAPLAEAPVLPNTPSVMYDGALTSVGYEFTGAADAALYGDYFNAISGLRLTVGATSEQLTRSQYYADVTGSAATLYIFNAAWNSFATLDELTAAGYTLFIEADGYKNQTIGFANPNPPATPVVISSSPNQRIAAAGGKPVGVRFRVSSTTPIMMSYFNAITEVWLSVGNGEEQLLPSDLYSIVVVQGGNSEVCVFSTEWNGTTLLSDITSMGYSVRIVADGYMDQTLRRDAPNALKAAPIIPAFLFDTQSGEPTGLTYNITGAVNTAVYGDYFNAITGLWLTLGDGAETQLTGSQYSVDVNAGTNASLTVLGDLLAAGYSLRIEADGYKNQTVTVAAPAPAELLDFPVLPSTPTSVDPIITGYAPAGMMWWYADAGNIALYGDYFSAVTEVHLTVGTGTEKPLTCLNGGANTGTNKFEYDASVSAGAVALYAWSADMNAFTTVADLLAAGYSLRIVADGYKEQIVKVDAPAGPPALEITYNSGTEKKVVVTGPLISLLQEKVYSRSEMLEKFGDNGQAKYYVVSSKNTVGTKRLYAVVGISMWDLFADAGIGTDIYRNAANFFHTVAGDGMVQVIGPGVIFSGQGGDTPSGTLDQPRYSFSASNMYGASVTNPYEATDEEEMPWILGFAEKYTAITSPTTTPTPEAQVTDAAQAIRPYFGQLNSENMNNPLFNNQTYRLVFAGERLTNAVAQNNPNAVAFTLNGEGYDRALVMTGKSNAASKVKGYLEAGTSKTYFEGTSLFSLLPATARTGNYAGNAAVIGFAEGDDLVLTVGDIESGKYTLVYASGTTAEGVAPVSNLIAGANRYFDLYVDGEEVRKGVISVEVKSSAPVFNAAASGEVGSALALTYTYDYTYTTALTSVKLTDPQGAVTTITKANLSPTDDGYPLSKITIAGTNFPTEGVYTIEVLANNYMTATLSYTVSAPVVIPPIEAKADIDRTMQVMDVITIDINDVALSNIGGTLSLLDATAVSGNGIILPAYINTAVGKAYITGLTAGTANLTVSVTDGTNNADINVQVTVTALADPTAAGLIVYKDGAEFANLNRGELYDMWIAAGALVYDYTSYYGGTTIQDQYLNSMALPLEYLLDELGVTAQELAGGALYTVAPDNYKSTISWAALTTERYAYPDLTEDSETIVPSALALSSFHVRKAAVGTGTIVFGQLNFTEKPSSTWNQALASGGSMTILYAAPELTNATTATVGDDVVLSFTDNAAWRAAITGIKVGGTAIDMDLATIAAGSITLDASLFPTAGSYTIVVSAANYLDATITVEVNEVAVEETVYDIKFVSADKHYNIGDEIEVAVWAYAKETTTFGAFQINFTFDKALVAFNGQKLFYGSTDVTDNRVEMLLWGNGAMPIDQTGVLLGTFKFTVLDTLDGNATADFNFIKAKMGYYNEIEYYPTSAGEKLSASLHNLKITFLGGNTNLGTTYAYAKYGVAGLYTDTSYSTAFVVPTATGTVGPNYRLPAAGEAQWTDGTNSYLATELPTTYTASATYTHITITRYGYTFYNAAGEVIGETIYLESGTVTAPTAPIVAGFDFAGWFAVADGTESYDGTSTLYGGATAFPAITDATALNSAYKAYYENSSFDITLPDTADDITGVTDDKATYGTDVTFTLPGLEPGSVVTYQVGDGEEKTLTPVGGVYTIPGDEILGDVVVRIYTQIGGEVEFIEYEDYKGAKVGEKVMLYTPAAPPAAGTKFMYDGTKELYWSSAYGAYVAFVPVSETASGALFKITVTTGTTTEISYDGDVTGNGEIDAMDAMNAYKIYNGVEDANITDMMRFRADVNGNKVVDVRDAQAILLKL